MIISSEYDKSLYLMMVVDGENRDKILELIKEIPEELYIQIRNGLKFQDRLNKGEISRFSDEYRVDILSNYIDIGNREYAYNICDDMLDLYVSDTLGPASYRFIYNITIYSFDSFEKTELFDKTLIGEFFYNYKPLRLRESFSEERCDSVVYQLYKIPGGGILSYEKNEEAIYTKMNVIVKLKNMSNDVSLSDLGDTDKLDSVLCRRLCVKKTRRK